MSRVPLCAGPGTLLVALGAIGLPCAAQEIAPFRITGIEGHAAVRSYADEAVTDPGGGGGRAAASSQAHNELRSEVFVMSHSYIFHPNFLVLDVGGGPVYEIAGFANDGDKARSRATLYNFVGRASFLRGKPFSGSLFYEHLNPTVAVTAAESFRQENSRYGFDFALSGPEVTTPMRLEFVRTRSAGQGVQRVTDDRTDKLTLQLTRAHGELGATQLHYQAIEQESLSGSPNLPIQSSTSTNHAFNVDTRLQFGSERQHEFTQLFSYGSRRYVVGGDAMPAQQDANLLLDVRLKPSPSFSGFGSWHLSYADNGMLASKTQSVASGVTWLPRPQLEGDFGLRAEDSRSGPFAMDSRGLDGALRYRLPMPVGELLASYSVRFDRRNQHAGAAQADAIGERLILGSSTTTLAHMHIVRTSVILSNANRTQVFVEDIDYRLNTVGDETRVQRLVGGNIVDGEPLLADYAYDTGGTFAHDVADQTANLNWRLSRYLSTFLRDSRSSPTVTSGTPGFAPEALHSTLYGVRADFPLQLGIAMTVGGNVERERVRETANPLTRASDELYLDTDEALFGLGNVGISLRRLRVDYDGAAGDVDLAGYGLRFWTRRWFGIDLSFTRNEERDTGGPFRQHRSNDAINAQWRQREFTTTARLLRSRETQGDFERAHWMFQLTARRDF
ncbi:hypothetical protein AZOA_29610 [Azoarcus sp. Aa7]|nr:hypothetical protein [Azoarcus sp. Aa7]